MGKLIYALILMFVIQFCLVVFTDVGWPGSELYNLVTNPTSWDGNTLLNALLSDLAITAGVGIAVGSFVFRNETGIYMGFALIFVSYGRALYELWQKIAAQEAFGDFATMMATLLTGGLIIAFIMLILEYARGRD